jgi:aconitate hydratase 2/2-methylisocitrate dehydratase
VHAIPYYAIKQGLLTVAKQGKINEFSGRILEIEGLPDLKVEQAFELSDASAERSAAGCTVKLNPEPIKEYLNSNIVLMKNMIADGYADKRSLERRIKAVEAWLAKPELLEADKDAEYAHVIEIDLADLKEPVLCCPNDPDDAKLLSQVEGVKIDEVFIGSCMTNIGHFRAASKLLEGKRDIPVKLWVAPPTKMDAAELTKEGHYGVFGTAGARTEMPGCSLCMGNQAQVREGATVVSTSTRNFPNRLGKNTNVYLASAELAAIASKLGRIPTVAEYQADMGVINADGSKIYKYMNFDQIAGVQGCGWRDRVTGLAAQPTKSGLRAAFFVPQAGSRAKLASSPRQCCVSSYQINSKFRRLAQAMRLAIRSNEAGAAPPWSRWR